ncbi:MAG: hypothetical protein WKG00_09305 [Polyangiaceae bacterium]
MKRRIVFLLLGMAGAVGATGGDVAAQSPEPVPPANANLPPRPLRPPPRRCRSPSPSPSR